MKFLHKHSCVKTSSHKKKFCIFHDVLCTTIATEYLHHSVLIETVYLIPEETSSQTDSFGFNDC